MPAPAPHPFDQLTSSPDDAEISRAVDSTGGADVVRAGLGWLQDRFDADAAGAASGVIQWDITHGGGRHRWQLVVAEGACNVIALDADGQPSDAGNPRLRPDVTLAMSGVEFARIVSGAAELLERFTEGEVLIAGNLPLARATATWFPR